MIRLAGLLSKYELTQSKIKELENGEKLLADNSIMESIKKKSIILDELLIRLKVHFQLAYPEYATSNTVSEKVKLNIGGNHLDLKRSSLTKSKLFLEENLLSVLFHERWDSYLL
jgi:uncharacterized protein YdcH (DUF465 family)